MARNEGLFLPLGNTAAFTMSPHLAPWGVGTAHPIRPLGTLASSFGKRATVSCLGVIHASDTVVAGQVL